MNVQQKIKGGTIRISGPGSDGLTRMQRRALQEQYGKQVQGRGYDLVQNSEGRFHGGNPVNGFTRQIRGRNSKLYAYIPDRKYP